MKKKENEMNMPIEKLKTSELIKAKWNYKSETTPEKLKKLIGSAEFQNSLGIIAVREVKINGKKKFEVIDGNHRYDALIELKRDTVTCENFGVISKAKAIVISRQRNHQWYEDDTLKYAELFVNEVLPEFGIDQLSDILPESKGDLEGLEKLLSFDWDQFNNVKEPVRDGMRAIRIVVEDRVYEQWIEWMKRCKEILGYDSEAKCFEFAVVEALNIPEKSLQ